MTRKLLSGARAGQPVPPLQAELRRCVLPVEGGSQAAVRAQRLSGVQLHATGKRQIRVQVVNPRLRFHTDLQQDHVVVLKHVTASLFTPVSEMLTLLLRVTSQTQITG